MRFRRAGGQFALANAVGCGLSATNLVLVGDQMQLAQPTQGAHPGESGRSALDYLLGEQATVPPDFGVFLKQTRRMHPAIGSFISEAVYEGRLESHPGTADQRIELDGNGLITAEADLQYLPVEHTGNAQGSEEEAEVIKRLIGDLHERPVWDFNGQGPRQLAPDDILLVAPFNRQVRLLKQRLGTGSRVGSVDKFQGQEARVVIVSMCSSTLEDSPRGAEFLFDPNRLNVAVSRARTLAVVVGSPGLVTARCRTIREMKLVNLFCRLVEYSARSEE